MHYTATVSVSGDPQPYTYQPKSEADSPGGGVLVTLFIGALVSLLLHRKKGR